MARAYAALPHEYFEEMAELTDEEWGRLTRALLRFSMDGTETPLTGNERFFWRRVVNREQGLQLHYEEVSAKRSAAGKKGMESRWGIANDNKDNQDKVKDQDKGKDKVHSPPPKGGRRAAADPAAQRERMLRDMAEMEQVMKGGADR